MQESLMQQTGFVLTPKAILVLIDFIYPFVPIGEVDSTLKPSNSKWYEKAQLVATWYNIMQQM